VPLPDGDVRLAALSFPDDLAWGGSAFAAWVLRHVLPLPVDDDPEGADYLLHAVTPLLAPVVALDRIGGHYRLHDRNSHLRDGFDVSRSRYLLLRAAETHAAIDRTARELGYGAARPRSVMFAVHRLLSLRLSDGDHPIAQDTRRRALTAGAVSALGRTDVGIRRRMLYLAWLSAVALAPRPLVRALARAGLGPRRARWLPRLAR
jgi:hypothetical protein